MGMGIPDPNTLFQSSQIVRQYSDTHGSVFLAVAVAAAAADSANADAADDTDSANADTGSDADCIELPLNGTILSYAIALFVIVISPLSCTIVLRWYKW